MNIDRRSAVSIRVVPSSRDSWIVAGIEGEVDLLTVEHLESELAELVDDALDGLIIDLVETTFFGAAGMGVLERVQRRVPTGALFAVAAAESTARPMRLIGMNTDMSIYSTVDLALSAFAQRREDRTAS